MDDNQQAAFVFSQSVCAMAEIEAMKVENKVREMKNSSPAYTEAHFMAVIDKYDIGYNAVNRLFRGIWE